MLRVESCVQLVRGKLFCEPKITYFADFEINPKKIKRGDLFIALEPSALQEAVANGAYGIIATNVPECSDDEIVYIEVESCEKALLALLKYEALQMELDFYLLTPDAFCIGKQIAVDKSVAFVESGDVRGLFRHLKKWGLKAVVSDDEQFLASVSSKSINSFESSSAAGMEVVYKNLFETIVGVCDEVLRLKIPEFLLASLDEAIVMLNRFGCSYELGKLGYQPAFEPIFVDRQLRERDFGKTESALIFCNTTEKIATAAALFVEQNSAWAKSFVFVSDKQSTLKLDKNIIVFFNDVTHLKEQLLNLEFNFALIVGVTKEALLRKEQSAVRSFEF